MNYYYDVLLNFQEKYYMFYEWDEYDIIEYAKKIPIIHTDTKTLNDMLLKIVKIDNEFLKQLENKTKLKQNKLLKYACIISDGKNNLALEFNDDGKVISKSSLLLDDELNINEFIYTINKNKINYKILNLDIFNKEIRQELIVKKTLQVEINNIYQNNNYSKLKYIYLEWFGEILSNIDDMYKNMLNKINNTLTPKEYHIYELIKLSYKNV